ncbi:MAG TPA: DEAD/DEAH box helicase, partial [Candidatus Krumholzibacteria bacterium]|nr:DEAD/DEAH box helicase [Candidatus Krumholzibacteria bacterium]
MSFRDLNLPQPIMQALDDAGYVTPTDIQAQAIPPALEGRDVLGRAKTGTGKTAAFALPILVRLNALPSWDPAAAAVEPEDNADDEEPSTPPDESFAARSRRRR